MRPFRRGGPPDFMKEHEARWCGEFFDKRSENPGSAFSWPSLAGQTLDKHLRPLLEALTQNHCSYCDGCRLRARERTPAIDHFRPKGRPEFWKLAFAWTNLYVSCAHCNLWKREQWDEALLAPDEEGYSFDRYFSYEPTTGEIEVSPIATGQDKERPEKTIEILGWNEGDQPQDRKAACRFYSLETDPNPDDFSYRFALR